MALAAAAPGVAMATILNVDDLVLIAQLLHGPDATAGRQ